jgi:hypothetical protein
MTLVTLIGEQLAEEGEVFTYLGPLNECKNCKLKNVCFNLKPGRNYKITQLREKTHQCTVHEGKVVVVEVSELPIEAVIDKQLSEETRTKIEKQNCKNIGCDYYEICTNQAIQQGKQYTIKKVHGAIQCPLGKKLYKVEIVD